MCVETLRIGLVFPRQSLWGVTCLGLLWKINVVPIFLLGNLINVCWKPCQNRAHVFPRQIDLRGHMPRFTLKNECFPMYLLRNPINGYWNCQNRGHVLPSWSIWGVTWLGLLEKWMFSHLFPWKCQKCVLKPSGKGSFFQYNQFEGSHG